jgi:hypothetical protein
MKTETGKVGPMERDRSHVVADFGSGLAEANELMRDQPDSDSIESLPCPSAHRNCFC